MGNSTFNYEIPCEHVPLPALVVRVPGQPEHGGPPCGDLVSDDCLPRPRVVVEGSVVDDVVVALEGEGQAVVQHGGGGGGGGGAALEGLQAGVLGEDAAAAATSFPHALVRAEKINEIEI